MMFPYYLSLGCSYNEYWNAPAEVAAAYYDAEMHRKERRNYELWLQGLYVKNALDASLAMAFWDKKHQKPEPYLEHPIAFTEREKAAELERKREEALKFFKEGQSKGG